MCNCVNIEPQSKECYNQMIVVDIPSHMKDYRDARVANGLSCKICIDPCIYDEICDLWRSGIVTLGCCCGHNKTEPFVNVADSSIDSMIEMGYNMNHKDKSRRDTFRLKSA